MSAAIPDIIARAAIRTTADTVIRSALPGPEYPAEAEGGGVTQTGASE
jgi:hypothetical protein